MNPAIGWVLRVNLAQRSPSGHEQVGLRPVVVVGLPSLAGQPRYPVIVVVPLTTDRAQKWVHATPALYPKLSSGVGGLPKDSVALLDQIQNGVKDCFSYNLQISWNVNRVIWKNAWTKRRRSFWL